MDGKILHWSFREFHEFPEALLEHSDTVEEIYLKENFIATIPAWLFSLTNLNFIQLSSNLLVDIPDEIGMLKNLEHLDVSKNRLTNLPVQLCKLKKLRYLDASDNAISTLHQAWGTMKSLGTLNFSKNRLTEIPSPLANSSTICELYFNDNNIVEIPTEILSMPKLRIFEADRCCLECLPAIIGPCLTYVRVFNNTKLLYYPLIYEPFLHLHYDYWSETVISADSMMIFAPEIIKRIVLPQGMDIILSDSVPCSLFEYTLRTLHRNRHLLYGDLTIDSLPQKFYRFLQRGPISMCGYDQCKSPIFTQCHFSLIRKRSSVSYINFSQMFCCGKCSVKWHEENNVKYYRLRAHAG